MALIAPFEIAILLLPKGLDPSSKIERQCGGAALIELHRAVVESDILSQQFPQLLGLLAGDLRGVGWSLVQRLIEHIGQSEQLRQQNDELVELVLQPEERNPVLEISQRLRGTSS